METIFDLKANRSVTLPIFLSVIGLFIAVILFGSKSCNGDYSAYHDLIVEPDTASMRKMLLRREMALEQTFRSAKDSLLKEKAKTAWKNAVIKNYIYINFRSDTTFDFYTPVRINPALIRKGIDTSRENRVVIVKGHIYDTSTAIEGNPYKDSSRVIIKRTATKLLALSTKYPSVGLWFFFTIAQMTLWFMVIALAISIVERARTTTPVIEFNFTNFIPAYVIPVIIVSLFVALMYFLILKREPVISEAYLIDNYAARVVPYGIAGYIAAIVCFGSFLFLANKLELLNEEKKKATTSNGKVALTAAYQSLKSSFNFLFLLTASILSAFVLWAGLLFHAVNSVDAMRLYLYFSGKPFLNYDFVYLIGLMHTLLLLVFYIPVKLLFNTQETTLEQNALAANQPGVRKYLTPVWESLTTILVTTSPLLTTIFQKFISNLFAG